MDKFFRKKKLQLASWLLNQYQPRVLVIDDEEANFSKGALAAARKAGYQRVERVYFVDQSNFGRLIQKDAFDVVILDIKGVVHQDIAKDGLQLAEIFRKRTTAYIVITSAHQYHLDNRVLKAADRVLEDRILTSADFVGLLDDICEKLSALRWRFWRRVGLRVAMSAFRAAGMASA